MTNTTNPIEPFDLIRQQIDWLYHKAKQSKAEQPNEDEDENFNRPFLEDTLADQNLN